MKKLIALCAAALFAASTFAATLNPVSLINPVGSTAGQGIVSTGPTTAPVWGSVSISTLTGVLPIANGGTGQTTAAAALTALGGLSTTTAASTYLTQANAASTYGTIANLALKAPIDSPNFTNQPKAPTAAAGTNTTQIATTAFVLANAVTSSSPTITTPNIVGVTDGSNAAAGSVGEWSCVTAALAATTSGSVNNIAGLTLPKGNYLVTGWIHFVPAATTVMQGRLGSISLTSATVGPAGYYVLSRNSISAGLDEAYSLPTVQVNATSASFPVYLISNVVFTTSTMQVEGKICYQRIH